MKFKVISANIRFNNPKDGKHDWNGRREIISEVINKYETDLLGTQEGWQPQLNDLNSLLVNLELVDSHREWIEDRMYPSIFINPKNVKVLESGDVWLSETPYVAASKSFGSAFPRVCSWIRAEFIATGEEFFYVNGHLDHVLSETRSKQIEVLLNEANKNNINKAPIILTGDFNESPFEDVRKVINNLNPELKDAWLELGHEEHPTHHSFTGDREGATRIDWIMTDQKIRPIEMGLYLKDHEGIYPTDHYLVLAKYEI